MYRIGLKIFCLFSTIFLATSGYSLDASVTTDAEVMSSKSFSVGAGYLRQYYDFSTKSVGQLEMEGYSLFADKNWFPEEQISTSTQISLHRASNYGYTGHRFTDFFDFKSIEFQAIQKIGYALSMGGSRITPFAGAGLGHVTLEGEDLNFDASISQTFIKYIAQLGFSIDFKNGFRAFSAYELASYSVSDKSKVTNRSPVIAMLGKLSDSKNSAFTLGFGYAF